MECKLLKQNKRFTMRGLCVCRVGLALLVNQGAKRSLLYSLVVQWTGIQGRGHRFSPELEDPTCHSAKAHMGSCGAQVL